MKKINWFTRMFMSWEALEAYILSYSKNPKENEQIVVTQLQTENKGLKDLNDSLKERIEEQAKTIQEKITEIATLAKELSQARHYIETSNQTKNELDKKIGISEQAIRDMQERLMNSSNEHIALKNEIAKKLDPLSRIEKTFFASSGNKGKGELGERQLKTWLEKSGMNPEMWTENLVVGATQVEFAIRADISNKWIPVDSKVLDPDFDEEGNFIINDSFRNKVQVQVKEVAKYLSKTNTADYGLLVLQNDNIYIKLFDEYPAFFEQMIKDNKIYICSPSTFIQFAWSMSNILDIYSKIHKDEKLFDEVVKVLTTVNKLSTSLVKTHENFNIAMGTHYPTLQKRQNALIKKMQKEDKIKELPSFADNTIENEEE